jgi:hypothetical protein
MIKPFTTLSLGSISKSRVYVSFEFRTPFGGRWWVSFGPTYNGTTVGVVAALGIGVFLAHVRSA